MGLSSFYWRQSRRRGLGDCLGLPGRISGILGTLLPRPNPQVISVLGEAPKLRKRHGSEEGGDKEGQPWGQTGWICGAGMVPATTSQPNRTKNNHWVTVPPTYFLGLYFSFLHYFASLCSELLRKGLILSPAAFSGRVGDSFWGQGPV